jgi:hypothetical protein
MQTLIIALALLAQDKQESRVIAEDEGVVVTKPKDEKWSVKKGDEGAKLYKGTAAIVNHRIEDLQIEILVAKKGDDQKWNEFDDMAGSIIKDFEQDSDNKPIPDRKVKKIKSDKAKFPGAGGPQGWFLHFEVYDKDQLRLVVRHWMAVDKQNPNHMLRVSIVGADDVYKKYEKDINFVLAALQTFKVKKKK